MGKMGTVVLVAGYFLGVILGRGCFGWYGTKSMYHSFNPQPKQQK
jgi:hypothetical protein